MQEIYIGNGTSEYRLHSLNEELPSVVERGLEGLDGPEMRIDSYPNPGIRGETIAQSLAGGSLITLQGTLRGLPSDSTSNTRSAYLTQRLAFAEAVSHTYDAQGRVQPLTLRFTDLTGRQLQAKVYKDRYRAALELPTFNEWFLQLRNPSGVLESQSTKSATVYLPQNGGVTYDVVYDIVYGNSSGGSVTTTSDGSAPSKPVITLYGPMQNPRITNTATNEYIALNHSMVDGDVITIDVAEHTIIQGTSTNRMGTLQSGSTFWDIHPGENTISLSATTYDAGYATVSYRESWEGV